MRRADIITLAHGGGGTISSRLTEELFLPAFKNPFLESLSDAAVFKPPQSGRLAFTTDSFVVDPIFFPGGDIGSLAIHGTVNDLAVSGAVPKYLSAGFVIEEGFSINDLKRIVNSMGEAAKKSGVSIVTGDTKVVPRGSADKLFINTAGIGYVPEGVDIAPQRVMEGDGIILSGTIGDHGMAVLTKRSGMQFETNLVSDSKPLNALAEKIIKAEPEVHMMRDPTRGGLAATLCEIAASTGKGILIEEKAIPINDNVRSVCEILGFDPLHVANEGKLVAFVPETSVDKVLSTMKNCTEGVDSAIIGTVGKAKAGRVEMKTAFIGNRIIEPTIGGQLPRIC